MWLLDRLFGKGEPVPDWASFFDSARYRAFLDAVANDLRSRSFEFWIQDGWVRVRGREKSYGLENLAQKCHGDGQDSWAECIHDHFDGMFQSEAEDGEFERVRADFPTVQGILKVRMYSDDFVALLKGSEVGRPWAPGVRSILVFDRPRVIQPVQKADLEVWGRTMDDLWPLAIHNVRAEGLVGRGKVEAEQDVTLDLLSGNSLFVTTHALFLEEYLSAPCHYGVLLAVPHRGAVVFHEIRDSGFMHAVPRMALAAAGMYREGPGSISPRLYWWLQGDVMEIPVEIVSREEIHMSPPDAFKSRVIEPLAPGDSG